MSTTPDPQEPRGRWQVAIPSIVSVLRLALLPFAVVYWLRGEVVLALCFYGAIVATDLADGWLARRLGASTTFGAWLDPATDIVVALTFLAILATHNVVPVWTPILPAIAAGVFLATYRRGQTYGRLGRYYGALLYVTIGIALAEPPSIIRLGLSIIIGLAGAIAIGERTAGQLRRRRT